MVHETVKIFNDPSVKVTATCVRVPVFYCHAESVNVETEKKLSARDARVMLAQAPGVRVFDNPRELMYPMPATAWAMTTPMWAVFVRTKPLQTASKSCLWPTTFAIPRPAILDH